MSSEMRRVFGKRVRCMRQRRGISLRGFALMIGIDKGFLVDIEYGRKSPTLDTIEKIASGLGVKTSDLFIDIEDEFVEAPKTG